MAMPTNDRDIAVYQTQRAHEVELNRATAAFEHAMVSPLFLLNGGAAVAFLTLLGAASAEDSNLNIRVELAVLAVVAWTGGLILGAVAVRAGYLAQQKLTEAVKLRREKYERVLLRDSPLLPELRKAESKEPETAKTEGEAHQARWRDAFWLALILFIIGVVFAVVAVIMGQAVTC
ncbi:hypothetical protein ACLQ2Q_21745 [Microbacterium sp. DT81.1]|uniref:hypothetical protein n=1 Tax=Microbacterium sp. DT81.1 TaxID=3393413 RepID=UPI003CEB191A